MDLLLKFLSLVCLTLVVHFVSQGQGLCFGDPGTPTVLTSTDDNGNTVTETCTCTEEGIETCTKSTAPPPLTPSPQPTIWVTDSDLRAKLHQNPDAEAFDVQALDDKCLKGTRKGSDYEKYEEVIAEVTWECYCKTEIAYEGAGMYLQYTGEAHCTVKDQCPKNEVTLFGRSFKNRQGQTCKCDTTEYDSGQGAAAYQFTGGFTCA